MFTLPHPLYRRIAECLLLVSLVLLLQTANAQEAPRVALTFDDGPHLHETPQLTAVQRNQALLDALAKHQVKATLFVTANNGANRPEGLALARAWGSAGQTVGNHTMSHPSLHSDKVTLAQYQQEILDCDAVIRDLPGYRKWFRFTYLREGNTPEKRDGMRKFLAEQSYRNAHVSIDTSDWRLNNLLVETLRANPKADVAPIKAAYLAHVWQRVEAYRDLSQRLQGRDIAQVLLLHHNLINALWLDDVIAMLKQRGWKIIPADEAYADPVYQLQPAQDAPGQSLLLSLAKTLGLWKRDGAKFGGWERLHDDGEFEIEQLKAKGF